jgi:hypothetical protein
MATMYSTTRPLMRTSMIFIGTQVHRQQIVVWMRTPETDGCPMLGSPVLRIASQKLCQVLRWSSGYDARLTRERSPVQSWDEVFLSRAVPTSSALPKRHQQDEYGENLICARRESNPGHKHGKLVCYHYTTSASGCTPIL